MNRLSGAGRYFFVFFLFALFASSLIKDPENIKNFAPHLLIILIPIGLAGASVYLLKKDYETGKLENYLTIFGSGQIILAKFFAFFFTASAPLLLNIALVFFLADMPAGNLKIFSCAVFLSALLSSALALLASSVECYFKSGGGLLSILTLPMTIPGVIISGIIIGDYSKYTLLLSLAGINLLMIPAVLLASDYLCRNIYNA